MAAELNSQREDQLDEIVLAYLKAVDAGETPDHQEIIARYPELATELAAFFVDLDQANRFSMPVWGLTKDLSAPTRTGGERAPDEPLPSTVAYQPESRERYTVVRLHAEGGIGRVHLVEDQDLGRQVALKELKPKFADDPTYRARFLEEARITGQLEHPGIVPVHELTTRAGDKKPFYTMRFIKGRTLSHAIKAYHRKREAGETGPLDLRELLNVFVGVCNAVAYAHSRGVIHRDLKPQNIALGDFGEALVLDWGLAKVLGEKNGEDSLPPVSLETEAERGETRQGARVGTIPYMSPEQAEGRIDLMDRRTDVYGLGAILYEILTGEPPFTGPEESVVLDRVQHEAPAPARRRVAATPVALEAVCVKALAKKREDRYSSAKELAQEIERFLADEPVAAYPEPLIVRARRWLGKHRTFATGAAALLVTAVVALATSTALITEEQKRTEGARLKAQTNLENFHTAVKAIDRMLNRVGMERLARLPGTEKERTELLEDALKSYEVFLNEDSDDPEVRQVMGLACQRTASLYRLLGKREKAKERYVQGVKLQEDLANQFPDRNDYGHELAITRLGLGDLLHTAGQNSEAEALYKEARRLLEPWAREPLADSAYEKTLAAILNSQGELYGETNRKEAEKTLLDALTLRKAMAGSNPRVAEYQQALARSHNSLGRLYINLGQKANGEAAHKAALEIQEKLVHEQRVVPDYQIDLATTFIDLAVFYRDDVRLKDAMDALQKARAIRLNLTIDHHDIPEYQHDLAQSDFHLGVVYFQTDRHDEATEAFQRSLDILEPLVDHYKHEIKFAISLANVYQAMGDFMKDTNRREPALNMYFKSIRILKEVLVTEPLHVEARKWLVYTHMFQAENLIEMKRRPEAIEDWKQMVELSEGQSNAHLRVVGAIALARLGNHTRAVQEVQDMIEQNLRQSATAGTYNFACVFSICSEVVLSDPKLSPAEQKKLAETYRSSAMEHLMTLRGTGLFSDSRDLLRKDPDLKPLRSSDEFKKLLHQVEEDAKGPSSGKQK